MRLYNQLQGGSVDSLDEIKENINEEICTYRERHVVYERIKIRTHTEEYFVTHPISLSPSL